MSETQPSKTVVVAILSETVGEPDPELGAILMRGFIKTFRDPGPLPRTMLFINGGVRLTTTGSPLIADIQALADASVRIVSCGTCLDFFKLLDKLEVGEKGTTRDAVAIMSAADHVIRL